jgi:hypothetical protein
MREATYVELIVAPLRECAKYKPAFGGNDEEGVTLERFRELYGEDPLYHWVGFDSPLMYAAHKAAGAMSSLYRQLGIGCERLLRTVIQDELGLNDDEVAWSYTYKKDDGKSAVHTLDARIDIEHLRDRNAKNRLRSWLGRAATELKLEPKRVAELKGVILEVRQGYKSADSKRQNADLRFGLNAYNADYLPVIAIVSTQASATVMRRYRSALILVLRGTFESEVASTFSFFNDVVGYDLVAFFKQNSLQLRREIGKVLQDLLTPDTH